MKSRLLLAVLIVFFVIGASSLIRLSQNGNSELDDKLSSNAVGGELGDAEIEELSGISAEELGKHSDLDDCWVVYDRKVYDI